MADKKVIALNTIIRVVRPGVAGDIKNGVAPTKPKTQEIDAGTTFMVSTEDNEDGISEYQSLKDSGAIRDYSKEDAKALKMLSEVIGRTEVEDDGEGEGDGDGTGTAAVKSTEADSGSVKTSASSGKTTTGSKSAKATSAADLV